MIFSQIKRFQIIFQYSNKINFFFRGITYRQQFNHIQITCSYIRKYGFFKANFFVIVVDFRCTVSRVHIIRIESSVCTACCIMSNNRHLLATNVCKVFKIFTSQCDGWNMRIFYAYFEIYERKNKTALKKMS